MLADVLGEGEDTDPDAEDDVIVPSRR